MGGEAGLGGGRPAVSLCMTHGAGAEGAFPGKAGRKEVRGDRKDRKETTVTWDKVCRKHPSACRNSEV